MTFGVCDCSRLAVTDWRLRRWRLWFLALMTATRPVTRTADFALTEALTLAYCLLVFHRDSICHYSGYTAAG